MVKLNVNGVVKNLMIPVDTAKSAESNDAAAEPRPTDAATTGRDADIPPQPIVKTNAANQKLVIVNRQNTPPVTAKPRPQQGNSSTKQRRPSASSIARGLVPVASFTPQTVVNGKTYVGLPMPVTGGGSVAHVIQPARANTHMAVQSLNAPATQSVVKTAVTRIVQQVNLPGNDVGRLTSPPVLATSRMPRPMVRVMSTPVPGCATLGATRMVITNSISPLTAAQTPNKTLVNHPAKKTINRVIAYGPVRPTGTLGKLIQSVPVTDPPRHVLIQGPGQNSQVIQLGKNSRKVTLTVPTLDAGASSGEAALTSSIVRSSQPSHVVVNAGLPSIVPHAVDNAVNVATPSQPPTLMRSPLGGDTASPTTTYIVPALPETANNTTALSNGVTVASLPKSLSKTSVNSECESPMLKIEDVFSLRTGDSTISSEVTDDDEEPMRTGEPLTTSTSSEDPSVVVLASWNKEDYCQSDDGDAICDVAVKLEYDRPSPSVDEEDDRYKMLTRIRRRTYGKFFQDVVGCLSDCQVAVRRLELRGRTMARASEFGIERLANRRASGLERAMPKCRLGAADPRRGDIYLVDKEGRNVLTVVTHERYRMLCKDTHKKRSAPATSGPQQLSKTRQKVSSSPPPGPPKLSKTGQRGSSSPPYPQKLANTGQKVSSSPPPCAQKLSKTGQKVSSSPPPCPQKLPKTRQKATSSPSLAKNDAPRLESQTAACPKAIAPKADVVETNGSGGKKLRYLMVKTNAGTFLVPITPDGGLITGGTNNTMNLKPSSNSLVIDATTKGQSVSSGNASNSLVTVCGGRCGTVPTKSKYIASAVGRSILSPGIKSDPVKRIFASKPKATTEPVVSPKRVKIEVDDGDYGDVAPLSPPTPSSPPPRVSNEARIKRLKLELKKQQKALDALRRGRLSSFLNTSLFDDGASTK